jgi:hypothetical protein
MFPMFLQSLGMCGTAVEVGVAEGNYSRDFLRFWPGSYWMVDLWRHIDGYDDVMNGPDDEHKERHRLAMEVAQHYPGRCAVLRMDTVAASQQFADGSLDFVYIDADHSYEGCKRDILAWAPKVRSRGILAGHDYYNSPPMFEVRKAVAEVCGGPCGITHETAPSWWVHIR